MISFRLGDELPKGITARPELEYENIQRFIGDRHLSPSNINSFFMDKKEWALTYLGGYRSEPSEAMINGQIAELYLFLSLIGFEHNISTYLDAKENKKLLFLCKAIDEFLEEYPEYKNNLVTYQGQPLDIYTKGLERAGNEFNEIVKNGGAILTVEDLQRIFHFLDKHKKPWQMSIGGINHIGFPDFEFKDFILEMKTAGQRGAPTSGNLRQAGFYYLVDAYERPVKIFKAYSVATVTEEKKRFALHDYTVEECQEFASDYIKHVNRMDYILGKYIDTEDFLSCQGGDLVDPWGNEWGQDKKDAWFDLFDKASLF